MSLYVAALHVSPHKKRRVEPAHKRRRVACPLPPSPAPSPPRTRPLPASLARLDSVHAALQHALAHALATCAIAPSEHTGIVRNVLNHLSLATYAGLSTRFDDLRRVCWIWEWDPTPRLPDPEVDPNPSLVPAATSPPKDWTRGAMGFVISPTSYYSTSTGKRVPVYGIGIEVDKGLSGGMAAVARWTANADKRRALPFVQNSTLGPTYSSSSFPRTSGSPCFPQHYSGTTPVPNVPLADLPQLAFQPSSLTRVLASVPPTSAAIFPSSPSKPAAKPSAPFPAPFPIAQREPSPSKLHTPRTKRVDPLAGLLTPQTPSRKRLEPQDALPTTPVHQRGPSAPTAPDTPSTPRRQALYDRVRLKSLTSSPVKPKSTQVVGGKLTRDQIQKLSQQEIRRRCLLGRLGGVAESIWMLFSSPVGSTATPTTRKRKVLPASDVIAAVVKSSPVPMSTSEASESLKLLITLCPFFLRLLNINGEDCIEMPPTTSGSDAAKDVSSPTKPSARPPPSPGSNARLNSAEQLLTRSPRRVKREAGGIRQVREIIRRELELA